VASSRTQDPNHLGFIGVRVVIAHQSKLDAAQIKRYSAHVSLC
jgi:hypothetical protein